MKIDEVAFLANEAGIRVFEGDSFADDLYISVLFRFANLVAEAERERLAKIFESQPQSKRIADAIRSMK